MNPIEQRVLDAIQIDGMLRFLTDLIAIPSLGGQETTGQEAVAAQMERCGLQVDSWELDFQRLQAHPEFGQGVKRLSGLGVVGITGESQGGRSLILNGHVDVVPPGDTANWRYPPWQGTLAQGRMYGRGSADMKGGLCCALFAAKALRDAGAKLMGKLIVESVIGEEDGGVGTLASVLRGYTADAAIIAEPTGLAVAPAQAGALSFQVTVPGLSAHGSVREEGVSAVEKFIPIHAALLALERERNARERHPLYSHYRLPYALSIGKVRAGDWASSVPEELVFEGRYGIAIGEDRAQARREFEQAVQHAAEADAWLRTQPPKVEWSGGQFSPASIPTDHPIVATIQSGLADASGREPRLEGVTYGSDMRLLVNVGATPAVLFGPGDVRRAHRPDEFVPVDELTATVRTLALVALRWCGHE